MKKKCDTIIISFPRSGLNWIRWNVEYFTGKPTPGCTRLVPNPQNSDFVFHRTHNTKKSNPHNYSCNRKFYSKNGRPLYKKVILLLRNPYEIYGRLKKTESQLRKESMIGYINNLISYYNFKGKKMIIYYENLITHYHREMRRIFKFLGIKAHISDIDVNKLKEESLESYNKKGNKQKGQHQLSDATSKIYHSEILTIGERIQLTNFLKQRLHGRIRSHYLKRYNPNLV